MRLRLLDAAADCLYELGYSKTTTIGVAARAGVSRGAELHHFPTKEHLVTEAMRHVLARRLEEFRAAFAALPEGADKPGAAIDILWQKLSDRTFYAWLELVVAARTDPALRRVVIEIAGHFTDEVQATAREFFSPSNEGLLSFDIAPICALAVMQGLALDRILCSDEDPRLALVLSVLRALVTTTLRAHDSPRSAIDEPSPKAD
jgi:AcrR family transcriptional regulator